MPYAPAVTPRGDSYLFQGILGAANEFSDALKKRQDLEKQGAFNDAIVDHSLQAGRITQDEANKYHEMSWSKKQGYANGLAANIADEFKRTQFAATQQNEVMDRALRDRIANSQMANQRLITGAEIGSREKIASQSSALAGQPIQDKDGNKVGVYDENGHASIFPARSAAEEIGDVSKLRAVTIPGSKLTVIVDDKNKVIPNSKLQGVVHPSPMDSMMENYMHNPAGGAGIMAPGAVAAPDPTPAASAAPQVGQVVRGYKYKGGDPSDPKSWEQAQQ